MYVHINSILVPIIFQFIKEQQNTIIPLDLNR